MRKPLLLAVLGLLALALAAYLTSQLDGGRERERVAAPAPAAARDAPAPAASLDEPPAPAELAAVAPPAEPGDTAALQPAADRTREAVPLPGRALAGRLELPPGVPDDPTLQVLVLKSKLDPKDVYGEDGVVHELAREGASDRVLATVPVDARGGFEVTLPEDREHVFLAVDGRYLFSASAVRVGGEDAEEPVLETRLGGCLVGQVTLPRDVPPTADLLASIELELKPDSDQFALMDADPHWLFRRGATLDGEGRFELRAVDTVRPYELEVECPTLANQNHKGLRFEPGERVPLDVSLVVGGTLRGTVADPAGNPVAEAEVKAVKTVMFGFAGDELAETETGPDGTFELTGVPPGKATILAEKDGFLESKPQSVQVADREVRAGLALGLEEGGVVAGRVTWADGKAAAGVTVRVSFDPEAMMTGAAMNAARGASGKAETGEDGRFEVRGLGKGPFVVTASSKRQASRRQAALAALGYVGDDDDEKDAHVARAKGVQPGTRDLELVLTPPSIVAGRVVDLANAPVAAFEVRASSEGAVAFLPGETRKRDFEDEEGRFELRGLEPGLWKLEARAPGYGPSQTVEVTIPLAPGGEPVLLVLAPQATVSGRVLDPNGGPVAGAKVTLHTEMGRTIQRLAGQLELPEAHTDEDGAFTLDGLGQGEVALVATHAGYAPSEVRNVVVAPGTETPDVVLALRTGARLTGEVYDKEGKPAGGAQLFLQDPTNWDTRTMRTEPDGTFLVENLRPGNWQVTAMIGAMDEVDAVDASSEGSAAAATASFMENMRFTMVELEDGEEEHVVLGAPPADPVRVNGRVTHAGQGATGALVTFFAEGATGFEAMKLTSVDAEGNYRVTLDEPGRYHVQVQVTGTSGALSQQNVEYSHTIPKGDEHRLDLELPTARISGRVLGPDGAPAEGARLTLTAAGGITTGTFMGGQYSEITAGADGSYTFEYLRPGVYDLAAGGAMFGGAFGTEAPHGRILRTGLTVDEGEHRGGVDFRLSEPGDIQGRVVDAAGQGIAGAGIFVRDSEGRLLERFSMITSDHDGSFRYRGLAPGDYQVSARKGELASPESGWVQVSPGKAAAVRLSLAPGTMLIVSLDDTTTEDLPDARVSVVDGEGREMHGMISFQELMKELGDGLTTGEQRFGPVPPGRYTVVAETPDGRSAKRTLTVAPGETQRRLKLRLR